MRGVTELALWLVGLGSWKANPDINDPSICRRDLWHVQPIDPSNNFTGGWPMLEVNHRAKVWDGAKHGRTYSHHAIVGHFDQTTVMLWTSAKVDEDSMGQVVMGSTSHDSGASWNQAETIFPEAMLPNQTVQHNFTYWASKGIPQRAWQCESVIRSPDSGTVYAIADSYNFCSDGEKQWDRGAGRIARALDLETGTPAGDPCWLSTNAYTSMLEFENTVYGTRYKMRYCKERETLNRLLEGPDVVPGWSAPLYNHPYLTSDPKHNVRELTYAIYDDDKRLWQRFWRDEAPTNNSWSVWTECSRNGKDWYPLNLGPEGNPGEGSDETHGIYQTNIPDAKTKQFFGSFSTKGNDKVRYLVSNPRQRATNLTRYPLTLAWQDVHDTDADWSFKHIGVVQTYPDTNIAPETREQYKNPGFSYPSAVQVGDDLIIVYSENKQNIWMASVPIASLRSDGKGLAIGPSET